MILGLQVNKCNPDIEWKFSSRLLPYPKMGLTSSSNSFTTRVFLKVIKLNFSHPNAVLKAQGFKDYQLHVDLADRQLLNKLKVYLLPIVGNGTEDVVIVPPGLAPLSILVITAIHGLTGYFPQVISMVKGGDGFTPLEPVNLQEYRNSCCRLARENLQVL